MKNFDTKITINTYKHERCLVKLAKSSYLNKIFKY